MLNVYLLLIVEAHIHTHTPFAVNFFMTTDGSCEVNAIALQQRDNISSRIAVLILLFRSTPLQLFNLVVHVYNETDAD